MLGAIAGDIVGSRFEGSGYKSTDFTLLAPECRYTDDSVLTVAVAAALLDGIPYADSLRAFARRHPDAGYGASFLRWMLRDDAGPYGSWGNGSAMRVSPVAWARDTEAEVLAEARDSARVTHDHPEGVKGAQAVALAVWMARRGADAATLRAEITGRFGYDLSRTVAKIRRDHGFDLSCQGSVPESLICALEADGWEAAVRAAVSLGGDADTMACFAGAVAQARFGGIAPLDATAIHERLAPDLAATARRAAAAWAGAG